MRFVVACLVFAASAMPAFADEKSDKKAEELKWAKGIVTDFLTAIDRGETRQAAAFLSADLKKSHESAFDKAGADFVDSHSNEVRGCKVTFNKEEMSPDVDEAVFRGNFHHEKNGDAEFTIRMIKEKESGKWRVNYFVIGDFTKAETPPKK